MEQLLRTIVERLSDNKDAIQIEKIEEGNTIKYTIYPAKEDIGKVVGKNGLNIKAIRTIMRAIGAKEMRKIVKTYVGD